MGAEMRASLRVRSAQLREVGVLEPLPASGNPAALEGRWAAGLLMAQDCHGPLPRCGQVGEPDRFVG